MAYTFGGGGSTPFWPPEPVMVQAPVVVLIVIGLFAWWGRGHGWRREAHITFFIILATILLTYYDELLIAYTNRFWRFFLFAIRGGLIADDPAALFATIRKLPPLIETPFGRTLFKLIFFSLLSVMGWYVGRRRVKIQGERAGSIGPFTFTTGGKLNRRDRLFGALLGAVDGYLVANFVLPRISQAPTITVVIPNAEVVDLLKINFIYVIVVFVAIVLAIAVLDLGRAGK